MSKIPEQGDVWRERLNEEQFRVARCGGTERAFTGKYWDHKADGVYVCVCCKQPLFDARTKYDSGSGWPSYWEPSAPSAVTEHEDATYGMRRVEVRCSGCDAHLGHVFPDGPPPTGLRYCINSASLDFEPRQAGGG